MTNSISLWFGVKNNLIKLVYVLQLFHVSVEYDANCQEIISPNFECIKFLYFSGGHQLQKQVVKFTRSTSYLQTCFKLRCSTQHYLHQSQLSLHTATDPHGQKNTTSKLTANYPHGSARLPGGWCVVFAINIGM